MTGCQFQVFQQSSSSKLVLKTVESRFAASNITGSAVSIFYTVHHQTWYVPCPNSIRTHTHTCIYLLHRSSPSAVCTMGRTLYVHTRTHVSIFYTVHHQARYVPWYELYTYTRTHVSIFYTIDCQVLCVPYYELYIYVYIYIYIYTYIYIYIHTHTHTFIYVLHH
jgi:hypothetical protein